MSHFAFVNPGGPLVPDLAKAKTYGITRLYWEARDPQITPGMLQAVRDRGVGVGIMRDPSWNQLGATTLAQTLDEDLTRLGLTTSQSAVLADIEYHDPAYIMAFLHEWRQLRPKRITGWTLEPLQGGWFTHDLVTAIGISAVMVYPQTYLGNMAPVAPDLVRSDLIERGVLRARVGAVYNAQDIPTHWDGIAFPFHELP
jgi:ribosomal protein S18